MHPVTTRSPMTAPFKWFVLGFLLHNIKTKHIQKIKKGYKFTDMVEAKS